MCGLKTVERLDGSLLIVGWCEAPAALFETCRLRECRVVARADIMSAELENWAAAATSASPAAGFH